jgi:hypothetical protein
MTPAKYSKFKYTFGKGVGSGGDFVDPENSTICRSTLPCRVAREIAATIKMFERTIKADWGEATN